MILIGVILGFFLIVVITKLLRNHLYLSKINTLEEQYIDYYKALSEGNAKGDIYERKEEILELLKRANQTTATLPRAENVGGGLIRNFNVDLFDNMFINDVDVYQLMRRKLIQAKGVYRKRRNESYSFLFWLDFIIYLPRNIFLYFSHEDVEIAKSKFIVKLLNFIYWIIFVAFSILKLFKELNII